MKTCFSGLQDDEEPQDTKYQIDGAYIPRIFILGKQKIGWCHPGFLGLKKTRVCTSSCSSVYQFFDIYYAFVFGYVEKSFGRLGGALASLKEVYWYIIDSHLPHLTFLLFFFFWWEEDTGWHGVPDMRGRREAKK